MGKPKSTLSAIYQKRLLEAIKSDFYRWSGMTAISLRQLMRVRLGKEGQFKDFTFTLTRNWGTLIDDLGRAVIGKHLVLGGKRILKSEDVWVLFLYDGQYTTTTRKVVCRLGRHFGIGGFIWEAKAAAQAALTEQLVHDAQNSDDEHRIHP